MLAMHFATRVRLLKATIRCNLNPLLGLVLPTLLVLVLEATANNTSIVLVRPFSLQHCHPTKLLPPA